MALLDLSLVTSTLTNLLQANVDRLLNPDDDNPPITVTVTPQAPSNMGGVMNTLSFHLYHLDEEGHMKNLPAPGLDVPGVAQVPMALRLFYILTVHHQSEDLIDPLTQQRLMGFAVKTLHDFPVITDDTRVGDEPVLPLALRGRGNELQVILRPVSPEDALNFWSAEEQQSSRLAAYYEVRVVLLEPEEPRVLPAPVLALGTFLVQLGAPHLECSRSRLSFDLPEALGLPEPRELEASPARVAATPTPDRLVLEGTALAGSSPAVFFKNARWARQVPPVEEVDVSADASWSVAFRSDRVEVDVRPTVQHEGAQLPLLPGLYTASVRRVMAEEIVLGQARQVAARSNEVGFAVAPRLLGHSSPDPDGRITVEIEPTFELDFGFGDPLEELRVQVIVDGQAYERRSELPVPAESPGLFEIAELQPFQFRFHPLFDTGVAGVHPLRLVVEGAESQPFWIEIP